MNLKKAVKLQLVQDNPTKFSKVNNMIKNEYCNWYPVLERLGYVKNTHGQCTDFATVIACERIRYKCEICGKVIKLQNVS